MTLHQCSTADRQDDQVRPRALRIALLNYEFPPFGGGASFASEGLARGLTQLGHEVVVLTSRFAKLPAVMQEDGYVVHRVSSWRRGPHECGMRGATTFIACALPRLSRLLLQKRFDLVHCFFGLPTGVLGLYARAVGNVPYLISLRGSDVPGYDVSDGTLQRLHRWLAPFTRLIWRRAEVVAPNSDSLADLARLLEPAIDYEVVPNAAFHPALPHIERDDSSEVRFICVARLIRRKGIDTLLEAFSTLSDCDTQLHLVGEGPEMHALQQLAARLGVLQRVVFHGYLSHPDVLRLFSNSDVFVLPTLSESCSMAMIEAMDAGLPVVATSVGGNPALIRHEENGLLVPPGTVLALSNSMRALIADPELRRRMGERNVELARSQMSAIGNARHYLRLYQRVLARHRSRA